MTSYNVLHDYRPDPGFQIKSHLYSGIANSYDESGLFSDELADIVSKSETLLDDYHNKFYQVFLKELGVKYTEPLAEESEEEPGEESEEDESPKWADLTPEDQYYAIRGLSWDELTQNLAAGLKDGKETFPEGEPKIDSDWYKAENYINFFPYLESIYRKLLDYSMVKKYCLELEPVAVNYLSRALVDIAAEKEDLEKANSEVQPLGKKIMWALIAFRTAYLNFMFKTLRDGGLKITHKMTEPISISSGYSVIFGGEDDVAAACEYYRALRAEWRAESITLFEANIYCRDWVTVEDQTLHPSTGEGKDESLQAQSLDFIGDKYGLFKIRRHASKVEWAAFSNSVQRGISVNGLEEPEIEEVDKSFIMRGSGIPMFRRLDQVDTIYRTQFVEPIFDRAGDIHEALKESPMGQKLIERKKDLDKKTPRNLERLFSFDNDGMLRTATIAYLELVAKMRLVEKQLEKSHKGSFKWYQNDLTSDGKGKLVEKVSKFSPEGMMLFLEKHSVLMSEAAIFSPDPYFTQGSALSVMGRDLELTDLDISIHHRLQCFNEQVGETLKELRKQVRILSELELKKQEQTSLDEKWQALLKASPEEYEDADKGYQEEMAKFNAERKSIKNQQGGLGFYRASKYEKQMGEELEAIMKSLEEDEMIKERVKVYQSLYPDLRPPDLYNREALSLEVKISKSFQKAVNELMAIRESAKSQESGEDYSQKREYEKIRAANKLIEETVKEGGEFNKLVNDKEGRRLDSEIRYAEASPEGVLNKYTPRALPGEALGTWGLRHLIHHLLWHAAAVNKHLRSILSRGPLEITVKNLAADDSQNSEQPSSS